MMRIISGMYKSRILKSPDSNKIRPTSDRAKETLFNILTNRISFDSIRCMDLFCGSGSLGLESISRGAICCCFVDEDVTLVKKNADLLKVGENAEIYRSDVLKFLNENDMKSDLIFCDPPYDYKNYKKLVQKISEYKTILVLEHSESFVTDDEFTDKVFLRKRIGTVNFSFYNFN